MLLSDQKIIQRLYRKYLQGIICDNNTDIFKEHLDILSGKTGKHVLGEVKPVQKLFGYTMSFYMDFYMDVSFPVC